MNEEYLQDLYGWIKGQDPSYEGRYSYDQFKQRMQDEAYATQMHGWISSKDGTFSQRRPLKSFVQQVKVVSPIAVEEQPKKKEDTTGLPSGVGSSASSVSAPDDKIKALFKKYAEESSLRKTFADRIIPTSGITPEIKRELIEAPIRKAKEDAELAQAQLSAANEFDKLGEKPKIEQSRYLNEQLTQITKDLIGKGEEYVVPEMEYRFGKLGFKFEEAEAGRDYMNVTASNGKTTQISLDNFLESTSSSEAFRLQKFIQDNTPMKGLFVLEKTLREQDKTFNNQKEVDDEIAKINQEATSLNEKQKDFLLRKDAFEKEVEEINKTPESEWNKPEFIKKVNELEKKRESLANEFPTLLSEEESLTKKSSELDRSIGKYVSAKAKQGTWYGGIGQEILAGFGSILADAQGRFIDITTEVLPTGLGMGENFGRNVAITKAAEIGAAPPVEGQSMDDWKSTLTEEQLDAWEDEVDDAKKKFLKRGLQPAAREGLQTLSGYVLDRNTTPEWINLTKEDFWGGAILGLARSLPAMIGRGNPAGWVQRTSQMYAQVSDGLMQEMEKDPAFANISEFEKSAIIAPIGLVSSVLEAYGLRNVLQSKGVITSITMSVLGKAGKGATYTSLRELAENEIKSRIAKGTLVITAAGLAEAETGAAQQLAETGFKSVYNKIKEEELFKTPESVGELLKQVAIAGGQEAVGGFILGVPNAIGAAYSKAGFLKMDDKTFETFENMANDETLQSAYITSLKQKIANGRISASDAKQELQNYRTAVGVYRQLPDGLTVQQKKEAMNLLKERKDLEQYIQGKDSALVTPQQNRINEINQELSKIAEQGNVQKIQSEADNVKAERAAKIAELSKAIEDDDTATELNLSTKLPTDERQRIEKQLQDLKEEEASIQEQEVPTTPVANEQQVSELTDKISRIENALSLPDITSETEFLMFDKSYTKPELENELETLKQELNAIQEQAAGQVPVQPTAGVGQEVEQGVSQAEPQVVTQEGQKEIADENVILSGLRDGFKAVTRNSFDIRSDADVMENIENRKSFTTSVTKNGKKYLVVGLKLKDVEATTSGRDGYSFAAIEDDGNLPSNAVDVLTQKAVSNVSSVYPNIKEPTIDMFAPVEGKQEVIPASIQSDVDKINEARKKELDDFKGPLNQPYFIGDETGPTVEEFINQKYDTQIEELKAKAVPKEGQVQEEVDVNKKLSDLGSRKVKEGVGSWRKAFNESTNPFRKSDILRAIVEVSTDTNELAEILEASKGMPEENNIANDIKAKQISLQIPKTKVEPQVSKSPSDFSVELQNKYAIELDLLGSPESDTLTLSRIVIPKDQRSKGIGAKVMKEIVEFADANNKKLVLTPSKDFGATSVKRLTDFYKRFGFVENKGKNKDFTIRDTMYRSPKPETKKEGAGQKIINEIDNLIKSIEDLEKTTLGINISLPVMKAILKGIKALVKAGMSLNDAINKAAKDNNVSVDDVIDGINSINEQSNRAAPSVAKILGKPRKKVTVDEMAALKDQIKLEARAAREAKADLNTKRKALAAKVSALKGKGTVTSNQIDTIVNRIERTNLDNPIMVDRLVEYIDKVFDNANYAVEMDEIRKLQAQAKSRNHTSMTSLVNEFASINPEDIPLVDKETGEPLNKIMEYKEALDFLNTRTPFYGKMNEVFDEMVKYKKAEKFDAVKTKDALIDKYNSIMDKYVGKDKNGKDKLKTVEDYVDLIKDLNAFKRKAFQLLQNEAIKQDEYEDLINGAGKTQAVIDRKFAEPIAKIKKGLIADIKNQRPKPNPNFTKEQNDLIREYLQLSDADIENLSPEDLFILNDLLDNISNGEIDYYRLSDIVSRMAGKQEGIAVGKQLKRSKVSLGSAKLREEMAKFESSFWEGLLGLGRATSGPLQKFIISPFNRAIGSYEKFNRDGFNDFLKLKKKYKIDRFDPLKKSKEMHKIGMLTTYLQEYMAQFDPKNKDIKDIGKRDWFKQILDSETMRDDYSPKELKIIEEIYKTLPKDKDGNVNPKAVYDSYEANDGKFFTKNQKAFFDSIMEWKKQNSTGKQKAANEMSGNAFKEIPFHMLRSRYGSMSSQITPTTSGDNGMVRINAGTGKERVSEAVGAINTNFEKLFIKGLEQTGRDFFLTKALKDINNVLASAKKELDGDKDPLLKAISYTLSDALSYEFSDTASQNILKRLVQARAAMTLLDPIRTGIEFTSTLLSFGLRARTLSGYKNLFGSQGDMKNLLEFTDSPLRLRQNINNAIDINDGKIEKQSMLTKWTTFLSGLPERTMMVTSWMPTFTSEFQRITGEKFDMKKFNDSEAYREKYGKAIKESSAVADAQTEKIIGPTTKAGQRREIIIFPGKTVGRDTVSGQTLGFFSNYPFRESTEFINGFREAGEVLKKGDSIESILQLQKPLGIALNVAAYGFLSSVVYASRLILLGDDDEEERGSKMLEELMTAKGFIEETAANAAAMAASKYAGGGRAILQVLGTLGIALTDDEETKATIKKMLKGSVYVDPLPTQKLSGYGTADKVNTAIIKYIPEFVVLSNTIIDTIGGVNEVKSIYDKVESKGIDALTIDEELKVLALSVMFTATQLFLNYRGTSLPSYNNLKAGMKTIKEEAGVADIADGKVPSKKKSSRGGSGAPKTINKTDMKKYFPDMYNELYGPGSPTYEVEQEVKAFEKEQRKMEEQIKKEIYGGR